MAKSSRPEGTGQPLICLPFPLTRVDNTPPAGCAMFPANSVDTTGKAVTDPSKGYQKLALETDPNLMYEHWNEYWRKIHGPKFAYKEGPDDPSIDYVMMYNQVHRITSGPSSLFPPPYKAPLDANGKLSTTPAVEVPPFKRPTYDGMAHICYRSLSETSQFFVTDKYKNKIIPEEQVFLRVALVFASAEYIIMPGPETPDPIVVVKFYQRKGGSREEFQKRLLWDQADLVYSKTDTQKYATRFALLLNVGPNGKNDPLYQKAGQIVDAMSMMSFRNMTDCENYLSREDYFSTAAVEDEFVDQANSEWFTALNYNVVNKVGKETATNRNLQPKK